MALSHTGKYSNLGGPQSFHQGLYIRALIHAALCAKDANSKEEILHLPLLLDVL